MSVHGWKARVKVPASESLNVDAISISDIVVSANSCRAMCDFTSSSWAEIEMPLNDWAQVWRR